jgi:hypothetical protein
MLYSTSHQLQAVSLLHFADPSGAVSTLKSLAAKEDIEPAVLELIILLQENNEGSSVTSPSSFENLTPAEFMKMHGKREPGSSSSSRSEEKVKELETPLESLESLGISELPDPIYSIRLAAEGPLLPKDGHAIIAAVRELAQVDQLEQLAITILPAEVAAAANHNPELAAEVVAAALAMDEDNPSIAGWAGVCLWAMAASDTSSININLLTFWAHLLEKVDDVEPSALAAFISYSIQHIISIEVRFVLCFEVLEEC